MQQRKRRSWHLHKKIRKIAKLEINDAFEIRGRVMVAMVVAFLLLAFAALYLFRWLVSTF